MEQVKYLCGIILVLVLLLVLKVNYLEAAQPDIVTFLTKEEGFVNHIYCDYCGTKSSCKGGKDCKKNPTKSRKTIGYGFTNAFLIEKGTMTKNEGKLYLQQRVDRIRTWLRKQVNVTLTKNQEDYLISVIFNIGEGNFAKSEALKLLNNNKINEVPDNIRKNWHRGNGIPHRLDGRRTREYEQLWLRK